MRNVHPNMVLIIRGEFSIVNLFFYIVNIVTSKSLAITGLSKHTLSTSP